MKRGLLGMAFALTAVCGGPQTIATLPSGSDWSDWALSSNSIGLPVLGAGMIAWTASGSVLAVPSSGGSAATLVQGESSPIIVGIDSSSVYYLGTGPQLTLKSIPRAGGSPRSIQIIDSAPSGLNVLDLFAQQTTLASYSEVEVDCKVVACSGNFLGIENTSCGHWMVDPVDCYQLVHAEGFTREPFLGVGGGYDGDDTMDP